MKLTVLVGYIFARVCEARCGLRQYLFGEPDVSLNIEAQSYERDQSVVTLIEGMLGFTLHAGLMPEKEQPPMYVTLVFVIIHINFLILIVGNARRRGLC